MSQEILLLEDDDSLNLSVSLKLQKEGYTLHRAFSIQEAEKCIRPTVYPSSYVTSPCRTETAWISVPVSERKAVSCFSF